MSQPPWAALFDWDGVVIDSSRHHERSWEMLADEAGLPLFDGHFEQSFGMRNEQIIPELLQWTTEPDEVTRLSRRKEELYRDSVRRDGIAPLPGVEDFLRHLHRAGVPAVIATSTQRENVELSINVMGIAPYFADMVTSSDVTHGKPHPEVFLKAADRADCPPARCVVFEDAMVGIQAGKAGGMKVVALTTTHPAARLQEADRVVDALTELDVAELGRWVAGADTG